MNDFGSAYEALQIHEGGLSDHPADRGGMTYKGISRKYWPHWDGWETIDQKLCGSSPGNIANLDDELAHDLGLQASVREFYHDEFWTPVLRTLYWCPGSITQFTFDSAVNHGEREAYRFLQRAYSTLSGTHIAADGLVGPVTRRCLKEVLQQYRGADRLLAWAIYERMWFYDNLADRDESQRVFMGGWGMRAMSFARLMDGAA